MCGIAGLVCLEPRCTGDAHEPIVKGLCDLQVHRGPDDSGVVRFDRVALGACRLSIIDLSPAGHMPMSDASGRWWIAYNGEVYNFRELRQELAERGHSFRSQTDTEVVLRAYIEWGHRALDRFVGMFAFAIYDRQTGRLVLGRDRYGVKPLYYARIHGHLLFASEVKALVEQMRPVGVDQRRLVEWFLYRNVDALSPQTLVEGVAAVLPGCVVTVAGDGVESDRVYDLLDHVSAEEYDRFAAARPQAVVDELEATLSEAVRLRLVSDVPVGILLSGGLDSSLITALAARATRDLTAFNVSIAGFPDLDERRFAEAVTRDRGVPLVSLQFTGAEFRRALAQTVYLSDFPLSHPNSVAYFLISQVARRHGVIVLLSGEGADELFGGYAWNYRRRWYLETLSPLLRRVPDRLWGWAALLVFGHLGLPVTSHAFRDVVAPTVALIDRYERAGWQAECAAAYGFVSRPADRAVLGAMLGDLHDFLTPLLRRLDRMSMGASVECREPYLDHRLVHKAINLPLAYRIGRRSDKWVLKQVALRHLPSALVHRRKAGFPLPLAEYIEPLVHTDFFADGFCQEHLALNTRGLAGLLQSWRRWAFAAFGLLTFELWGRLLVRGESLADVEKHIARTEHLVSRPT